MWVWHLKLFGFKIMRAHEFENVKKKQDLSILHLHFDFMMTLSFMEWPVITRQFAYHHVCGAEFKTRWKGD